MSIGNEKPTERRILVVDDVPELLEELANSLSAGGWQVDCASNAALAWEKLDVDQNITVLLTDIRMPGMDGLSLAKRVCERRGDARAAEVVLLTGHGTLDDAVTAFRIGAFDFLSKPITLRALLDATDRAHRAACDRRDAEARRAAEIGALRTEREKLHLELESLENGRALKQHALKELSRSLSHEMRTPLAALTAAQEFLNEKADLPASEVAHHMTIARDAGARLTEIADDFVGLLALPDPRSFDFRIAAPDLILQRVHAAADAAGHRILDKDTAGGHVETDVPVLVKLLGRLVGNAITWSSDKAEVIVSAYAENDHEVTFEVTDHGPAMSPAHRPDGLGLELSLAEQTACLLGGHLRLLSEPGQGTRAAVILPRNACLQHRA